ncbi:hypothetical protein VSDG_01477 [Cytospora chrysosperma]|uniref:Uncharacterized protein n=1 Tax=Cytospora chrysosperma TaxID=252740 RepID=A0A423WJ09_CYTCH|nr:hypothetical protein VSDG_01477 [Valsa sordida]
MGNRRTTNHRPIKETLKQNREKYPHTGAGEMPPDYQATDDEEDLRYSYEHFPPQDNTYGERPPQQPQEMVEANLRVGKGNEVIILASPIVVWFGALKVVEGVSLVE